MFLQSKIISLRNVVCWCVSSVLLSDAVFQRNSGKILFISNKKHDASLKCRITMHFINAIYWKNVKMLLGCKAILTINGSLKYLNDFFHHRRIIFSYTLNYILLKFYTDIFVSIQNWILKRTNYLSKCKLITQKNCFVFEIGQDNNNLSPICQRWMFAKSILTRESSH